MAMRGMEEEEGRGGAKSGFFLGDTNHTGRRRGGGVIF